MKKITIIFLLSFFVFSNLQAYNITKNEENLLNNFSEKLEKLDKYELENINQKITLTLKQKKYHNSWKVNFLLSKVQKYVNNEIQKKWKIIYNHYDFILDFSDLKNVLWFSHNVFIAKVIKNKWTNFNSNGDLTTDFEVKVLYNIKWNLKWNINTIFQGWYDKNNILNIWYDNIFLEEWKKYILVTMWDIHKISSHENWVTPISKKNTDQDLKKINDFIKAYINENNFDTPNSFKSLNSNEKDRLYDINKLY